MYYSHDCNILAEVTEAYLESADPPFSLCLPHVFCSSPVCSKAHWEGLPGETSVCHSADASDEAQMTSQVHLSLSKGVKVWQQGGGFVHHGYYRYTITKCPVM